MAVLLAGIAAPASGQIYSWRDANGTMVYSDHAPDGHGASFRIMGTAFRATRPAETGYTNQYDAIIEKYATLYMVSPHLVRAVIQVESGFNPRAISAKGAMGLMQLMPATAIEMGVGNPFDPEENIRAGTAYLRLLLNRYADNQQLALAAYTAGPERVQRFGSVPPYRETRDYIAKVSSRANGGAPAVGRSKATAKAALTPKPAARTARVYKYWERTEDGRLIVKFSDTKPASGNYEIVR